MEERMNGGEEGESGAQMSVSHNLDLLHGIHKTVGN
jgi:hypothetical protein